MYQETLINSLEDPSNQRERHPGACDKPWPRKMKEKVGSILYISFYHSACLFESGIIFVSFRLIWFVVVRFEGLHYIPTLIISLLQKLFPLKNDNNYRGFKTWEVRMKQLRISSVVVRVWGSRARKFASVRITRNSQTDDSTNIFSTCKRYGSVNNILYDY